MTEQEIKAALQLILSKCNRLQGAVTEIIATMSRIEQAQARIDVSLRELTGDSSEPWRGQD